MNGSASKALTGNGNGHGNGHGNGNGNGNRSHLPTDEWDGENEAWDRSPIPSKASGGPSTGKSPLSLLGNGSPFSLRGTGTPFSHRGSGNGADKRPPSTFSQRGNGDRADRRRSSSLSRRGNGDSAERRRSGAGLPVSGAALATPSPQNRLPALRITVTPPSNGNSAAARSARKKRSPDSPGEESERDFFKISDGSSSDDAASQVPLSNPRVQTSEQNGSRYRLPSSSPQNGATRPRSSVQSARTQGRAETSESDSDNSEDASDKDVEVSTKADRSNGLWLSNSRAKDEYAMILLDFDDTSSQASSKD